MSNDCQNKGLSAQEVNQRIDNGQTNVDASVKTISIKQILYKNIFTLFNAVNLILALIVLLTGSYKNLLFMGVIICNTAIGIIQEIRSKKTTDKLTIVAKAKVKVWRDWKLNEIAIDQIVLDDVIELGRGDQVPSDCKIESGHCDVNESLLTGESDLLPKKRGDVLMSGSYINSGKVICKVIRVGADNYATKITAEAKAYKAVNSEIMTTMNSLIKFVSFIIFPLGIILFSKSYFLDGTEITQSILTTVSALIGMIPEGLILLTSTVLAVSVVRLANDKVLVQQLYCIETLARVDTLCLDKTGTITSGEMRVAKIVYLDDVSTEEANVALASLMLADNDKNETSKAIDKYYKNGKGVESISNKTLLKCLEVIPFSSDKKWSGAKFDSSSYVMGAAQFILNDSNNPYVLQSNDLAKDYRVIVLAKVGGFDKNNNITGDIKVLAFVCIEDIIRQSAYSTISYFASEGVDLKVISGDDPRTVSGIAKKVGIKNADNYVDATTLDSDKKIEDAINKYSVFGRVKPEQKKAFVTALQKYGHTVAMTGDGVNDVLSLKQADCSVAMASGSSAACNVAHLVLTNNDFSSMTNVVGEGRRSINNLQRSASLFLVKTLVSMILAVLFLILPWSYPFQPIQMTLVSAFTIGLPSFVLALEPNSDRIKGKFLENVIVKSIPSAFSIVITVLCLNIVGYLCLNLSYEQISSMCVLMMSLLGISLVVRLSIPFTPIRIALIVVTIVGTLLGATFFNNLFNITSFTNDMFVLFATVGCVGIILFIFLYEIINKWHNKRQSQIV